MKTLPIIPPPWSLTGDGYIVVYGNLKDSKIPPESLFIPKEMQSAFKGKVGMVMLIDYKSSEVGPYCELLFIPGLFKIGGRYYFSISKIYVSSESSVISGRANWKIPKELAQFQRRSAGEFDHWTVEKDNKTIFEASFFTKFKLSLPIKTAGWPKLFSLAQPFEEDYFLTAPIMRGRVQLSKIVNTNIDPNFFPNIKDRSPLFSIKASEFNMTFLHSDHLDTVP